MCRIKNEYDGWPFITCCGCQDEGPVRESVNTVRGAFNERRESYIVLDTQRTSESVEFISSGLRLARANFKAI